LTAELTLNGRYQLDHPLAAGGMGEVWRATDTVLGRTVAVKVLLPALLTDPEFGRRFRAEARMMAALRHRGIVDVFDYGEAELPDGGQVAYLVMECVDGQPLSERLAAGPLDQAGTLAIVGQAARALHAAHGHGIVHRDVKPGNLLVEADGTVRLVDFGIARSAAATAHTAGQVVGTALYIAPEQAAGRPVSAATDVYALGAVAYHCLAGTPPFTGDNPVAVAARHIYDDPPPLPEHVHPRVRHLVERAMAKDPADRYPTAAAFAAAVRQAAFALDGRRTGRPSTDDRRRAALAGVGRADATAPAGLTNASAGDGGFAVGSAAVGTPALRTAGPHTLPLGGGPVPVGLSTSDDTGADGRPRPAVLAAAGVLLALVLLAVWVGLTGDDPATPATPPGPTPDRTPTTAPASTEAPGPAAGATGSESGTSAPATSGPAEPTGATTTAPPPADPPPAPEPTAPAATAEPAPTTVEAPDDPGDDDGGGRGEEARPTGLAMIAPT
jgi:serine/threonine-protein kinase